MRDNRGSHTDYGCYRLWWNEQANSENNNDDTRLKCVLHTLDLNVIVSDHIGMIGVECKRLVRAQCMEILSTKSTIVLHVSRDVAQESHLCSTFLHPSDQMQWDRIVVELNKKKQYPVNIYCLFSDRTTERVSIYRQCIDSLESKSAIRQTVALETTDAEHHRWWDVLVLRTNGRN